ncbi:hypothetical protein ACH419_36545 [Streptomyces bobili]|uniref:hypothetical protein n=1 Tax=Streptomyces bobili TaxID=67280 RepID=UPI00378D9ADC
MYISAPAPEAVSARPSLPVADRAVVPTTAARAATSREHRYALAGNANVRALLAQGIHPASQQPFADAPGANCGTCTLAYRVQLPVPGGEGTTREHWKCAMAPLSRRGRQGIDLRPDTPACTLHCAYTDWPFDPDGHAQTAADAIGHAQDHPDDRGVYAVYRIFGIDLKHQRARVELETEMIPKPAVPGGYTPRKPESQRSRPDKPHLYRFWTRLSRLHTAHITHPTGAGDCTHPLVRSGRILTSLGT